MVGKSKPKVSTIIPIYKPDEKVFKKVKEMIKRQTIKSEIIEIWNNPEAVSLNKGIKKARGEIIVTLAQDCVPHRTDWLKKLIKPLEKKKVVVSVSALYVTGEYWKKYPFLTRILTLNERIVRQPVMDARACAYRKKDLVKVGMFNEDPRTIAIDGDLRKKLEKIGRIAYPKVVVDHLHPLTNERKIRMIYNYAEANGKLLKAGMKGENSWLSFIRATPVLGMLPIIYVFPYRKLEYLYYLPIYLILTPFQHLIELYGFWKGFFLNRESMRNKEVLQEKNN